MTLAILGIVGIILLVIAVIAVAMIVCLIIAVVIRKKNKIVSNILLGVSASIFLFLLGGAILIFAPKKVEIDTPSGTVKVWDYMLEEYLNNVANDNLDRVEELLEEEPALVYSYNDYNEDILQRAALNGNIEMLELALEYGAEFDDELILDETEYNSSIQAFLDQLGRRAKSYDLTDEDVYEIVEFMLENDASVEINDKDTPNALFCADDWICYDKVISDEDIELVELLHSHGASYSYELSFVYVETMAMKKVEKDDNYRVLQDLVDGD